MNSNTILIVAAEPNSFFGNFFQKFNVKKI